MSKLYTRILPSQLFSLRYLTSLKENTPINSHNLQAYHTLISYCPFFCLSVLRILLMMWVIPLGFVENAMIKLDDCSYGLLLLVRFSRHYPLILFLQLLEMIAVDDYIENIWLYSDLVKVKESEDKYDWNIVFIKLSSFSIATKLMILKW